ncbi:MAG: hypothetical protein IH851_00445 [Armatimonadetes bacterium]|nr:hypothetical protein [Armatimonadota bacterium]
MNKRVTYDQLGRPTKPGEYAVPSVGLVRIDQHHIDVAQRYGGQFAWGAADITSKDSPGVQQYMLLQNGIPLSGGLLRVTIDTNVLISGVDDSEDSKEKKAAFRALMQKHDERLIDIALSSRFTQDKVSDTDLERVKRHYSVARLFPVLHAPFRLGIDVLGEAPVGGEQCKHLYEMLGVRDPSESKKNDLWDADHLCAHLMAQRDWFLTYDRRILSKSDSLARLGIRVCTPPDLLKSL